MKSLESSREKSCPLFTLVNDGVKTEARVALPGNKVIYSSELMCVLIEGKNVSDDRGLL